MDLKIVKAAARPGTGIICKTSCMISMDYDSDDARESKLGPLTLRENEINGS